MNFLSSVLGATKSSKIPKLHLGGDGKDALATDPRVAVHLGVHGRRVALSVITWKKAGNTFHCKSFSAECKSFRTHRRKTLKTKTFKTKHYKKDTTDINWFLPEDRRSTFCSPLHLHVFMQMRLYLFKYAWICKNSSLIILTWRSSRESLVIGILKKFNKMNKNTFNITF